LKHIQVDTTENKDKQGLNKQNEIKTQEQMMNNEEQLKNNKNNDISKRESFDKLNYYKSWIMMFLGHSFNKKKADIIQKSRKTRAKER